MPASISPNSSSATGDPVHWRQREAKQQNDKTATRVSASLSLFLSQIGVAERRAGALRGAFPSKPKSASHAEHVALPVADLSPELYFGLDESACLFHCRRQGRLGMRIQQSADVSKRLGAFVHRSDALLGVFESLKTNLGMCDGVHRRKGLCMQRERLPSTRGPLEIDLEAKAAEGRGELIFEKASLTVFSNNSQFLHFLFGGLQPTSGVDPHCLLVVSEQPQLFLVSWSVFSEKRQAWKIAGERKLFYRMNSAAPRSFVRSKSAKLFSRFSS